MRVRFSEDGKLVAASGQFQKTEVWNSETGAPFYKTVGLQDDTPDFYFSPSGGQIAGSVALIVVGFAITAVVAWLGNRSEPTR